MTKALLTTCALFCLTLTGSCLHCKQCYLDIPNVGCLPKTTECVAKDGQMCVTVMIMNRDKTMYKIHGCTVRGPMACSRITKTKVPGESIIPLCCKSGNFCNK